MADVDRAALTAELAGLLGLSDPADSLAARAVDTAVEFVETTVEVSPLQSSPMTDNALVGFSRAMYLDRVASRGQVVPVADGNADTLFLPEDPWRHWRHFFEPLRVQWGIA